MARDSLPAMRIVVLGAGFGGLELTTRLSEEFGDDVDVVLIDQSDGFVFGFSKLDVMFGRTRRPSACATRTATSSSPACGSCRRRSARSTRWPSGSRPTPGASTPTSSSSRSAPTSTRPRRPGLVEGGHEFYTVAGAFALRDVLAGFEGGRVIVGVTSTPFKCPPAPSETALLMHDFLTERGLRDRSEIALVMPLPRADPAVARRRRRRCSPPSPSAASTGIPDAWSAGSTRPARSRSAERRRRDALRPVPRRPGAPRARGRRGVGL